MFDLALQHYQAGRLQEAERLCRQIHAEEPTHADALHLLGLLAHQAGQKKTAADLIRKAVALKPDDAEAHSNLGNVLREDGQLVDAVAACEKAIALNPKLPQAHNNLGNAFRDQGEIDKAIDAYRRAIFLRPDYGGAFSNLGVALKEKGQIDDAIAAWRQAVVLNPNFFKAYSNLGNALREMGRLAEAIAACRKAIALNPAFSEAYSNLGVALKENGQFLEAAAVCRQAVALNPSFPEAHNNLANALRELGDLDPAIASCRRTIALNPNMPEAHNSLGNALKDKGLLVESIAAYRQAIALRPENAEAYSNLSVPLKDLGKLDEALVAIRQAIALNPAIPEAHLNLGNILKDAGQIDEAIAAYRRAISLRPCYAQAGSNLLYAMHFHSDYGAEAIAEEHRRWNRLYAEPLRALRQSTFSNVPTPDRRLRIGYVSPDFRSHPVGRFLIPLMDHHDRAGFEIFCYSDVLTPDLMTGRIESRADVWRNIVGLSDEATAALVRQDGIDILVDLTMHMARNRLLVLARKPAPVQVTYLAYCSTTGLDAIDYRLTDPHLDPVRQGSPPARLVSGVEPENAGPSHSVSSCGLLPSPGTPGEGRVRVFPVRTEENAPHPNPLPEYQERGQEPNAMALPEGADEHYSEKSIRLPDVYWCYDPGPATPDVAPLPEQTAGQITFGCLNNFAKVSPEALSCWIQLLKGLPTARLILHARQGEHRRRTLDRLQEQGVDPARLTFVDFLRAADYFRQYDQIDIALDPFPYAGGTTTCDAMWMGVPVVTLAGKTAVGRSGVTLLASVGLNELIAKTPEEYVQTAVALAADLARLGEMRATLRERMRKSPLMDAPRFARDVEAAYRQMWRTFANEKTKAELQYLSTCAQKKGTQ